ncbi:MAG: HIT family protein [Bryobacteraceae bacterium]
MTGCAFCRIAAGLEPAALVYRDDLVTAFLDARPLFAGHVLLIPNEHHGTLADLPTPLLSPLFAAAQRLALAVERGMQAEGTFVAMNNRVSQSVPHLHIHIVPRRRKDGLRGFFWPRFPYKDSTEMEAARSAISEAIEGIGLGGW